MAKLRDKFWLWGQTAGSHHCLEGGNLYKLPGKNTMKPAEGAEFFGIKNCCRVVMGNNPLPPFNQYSQELKGMDQVVWSIVGDCGSKRNDDNGSDLDEVLCQAENFPNITGSVLDDFFKSDGIGRYALQDITKIRNKLHSFSKRKLDLWMVWYDIHLDCDVQNYLDLCDVITFWTWKGCNLSMLDVNIPKVIEKTPDKRHLVGCYMWNYGESKPLTMDQMKFQLDRYYDWLYKGYIDGVIFCSNCIMDIGLETVELTRNWIKEVGDAEVEM
jgi:hypothetical protein